MGVLTVMKIFVQQDKVLLFGRDPNYHVIATHRDRVKVGDVIEYELGGTNFGWFHKVVSK